MYYRHIVLTGFMGTGKSTVGRELAVRLGRGFVDTDVLIEARCGRTVAQLFAEKGESAFRAWETAVAEELAQESGLVIATGGGMMLKAQNAAALSHESFIICLTAHPTTILARVQQMPGERPLLNSPDPLVRIEQLLAQRLPVYTQFAQVDTTGQTVEQVVAAAMTLLGQQETITPEMTDSWITLNVNHPDGHYPVILGQGVLGRLRELAGIRGPFAVITDDHVGPYHAWRLGEVSLLITVPAGEQHKNLETIRFIYDRLLAGGFDRKGTVVALGGGVVGDMAGFAAATFMRGVPFVQCPTTVLSMVDASVGGKVGVDLPQGKNLVGAFKQPQAVLADLATLSTLPLSEFRCGLAEVVKHGLLTRPDLLTRLAEQPLTAWLEPARQGELQQLLADAIQVKQAIVERDPFEQGERAWLNLGHTFGHAIEQVSGYQITHGEGVAMGLVAAADLSARLGFCDPELSHEITRLLTHLGLPGRIPGHLPPEALYRAMQHDKKKAVAQLRFVLLQGVGQPRLDAVPAELVMATLTHLSGDGELYLEQYSR